MKNKVFIFAIGLIIVFGGLFFVLKENFAPATSTVSSTPSSSAAPTQPSQSFSVVPVATDLLIKPHSITKGPANAKVTVVEYLDPECEACAAMYPIFKKISEEFKSDIKVVVRYMTYHQNSNYVANILEGIRAENKYWEAIEILFGTQDQWANHHAPKPELIPELLKPLKLKNLDQIIADAKAGKYNQQIQQDVEDGKKAGVQGTPTFFVNGNQVEELGYAPLRSAISDKLK